MDEELSVGQVAGRAGVSAATLHHYERLGLITSARTSGNQRRYSRHVLRRVAFVAAGQRVGLTLSQIGALLARLPAGRSPTQADWTRLARPWKQMLAARIAELQALQDSLDGCIGCGCLSLQRCALFNPGDTAAGEGPGSRWLRRATAPPT